MPRADYAVRRRAWSRRGRPILNAPCISKAHQRGIAFQAVIWRSQDTSKCVMSVPGVASKLGAFVASAWKAKPHWRMNGHEVSIRLHRVCDAVIWREQVISKHVAFVRGV